MKRKQGRLLKLPTCGTAKEPVGRIVCSVLRKPGLFLEPELVGLS